MSTVNPFSKLDPDQAPAKQEAPKHQDPPKHEVPKHHDVPKQESPKHKNPAHPVNDEELKTEKEHHEHHKHTGEGVKPKGVPAEPHPLDRKSGTGRGKEVSKGGAGRHAWGTLEDELKREGQYEDVEEEEIPKGTDNIVPENAITLEEYKHKTVGEKDPKTHEPPVLGSHSQGLGFKTEEGEKTQEKKESHVHQEKVEIDEKDFPKLG